MQSVKQAFRGYTLELLHRIRLEWRLRNVERQCPILVYQMGKVGSSTVVHTLDQLNRPEPVLQIHTLNPDHLQRAIAKQRGAATSHLPEHLIASSILVRKLSRGIFPCRIITLTREPVARVISFAFQDWQKKAPEARSSDGNLNVDRMIDAVNALLQEHRGHADPTHWFERELNAVFDVDVFAEPYDRKQGYTILREGNVSVLVIRLEDLNRSLPSALAAFLDINPEQVVLKRANEGGEKWYFESLRAVKNTYQIPPGVARSIFNTQYFQHFYHTDRDRARKRWAANDGA